MQTIVTDYETYYNSKDYSLKKLPTIEYVRDPRFKVHGVAIKIDDAPAFWVTGRDIPDYYASLNWGTLYAISHNSPFDQLITYEKFGKIPAYRVDTLGLARGLLPHDMDFDLDSLGRVLGVGGKIDGSKALQAVNGVRDLSPEQEADLAHYAVAGDAETTYRIFQLLWPLLPVDERRLLDLTIRMATEGVLRFNPELGREALSEALAERQAKIDNTKVDPAILRSSDKFAALLQSQGVEPPTKISPKTGKPTWAFSKDDREFLDLLDHPEVAHLVAGRMAAKSTSEPTRVERILRITSLEPKTLPMPLNYAGAHTLRWSGGGKINPQNFKRKSKLRRSIEAPDGYVIVVGDSAQIELRLNLDFCGQFNFLNVLRAGGDVYRLTAAPFFDVHPDIVTYIQRQFGKVTELGAGYQMGWRKFKATCAIGPMGNPPIFLTDEEAQRAINTYRVLHPEVVNTWNWLNNVAIPHMARKDAEPLARGPVVFGYEHILLPNGTQLRYPALRYDEDGWCFGINGVVHRLYGGKLLENIIQALARVVIAEQILKVDPYMRVVSMTHDEIIAIVPAAFAEHGAKMMHDIMSVTPSWAPNLPLSAEVGYAKEYSK